MKKAVLSEHLRQKTYPSAAKGVADSKKHVASPQTLSPTYALAFADDPGYSGGDMYVNGAPGIAFQTGGSLLSITGQVAQGTVARDGNLWKTVQ